MKTDSPMLCSTIASLCKAFSPLETSELMNSPTNKLKRRDFLTGAASTIGAGLLAIPGLSAAQGIITSGGGSVGAAPMSLYYWNGSSFIPAGQAIPNINASQIQVQI